MRIVSWMSPEDTRFVLDCLEDDDLVLAVRRNEHSQEYNLDYIGKTTGCDLKMAKVILNEILKT